MGASERLGPTQSEKNVTVRSGRGSGTCGRRPRRVSRLMPQPRGPSDAAAARGARRAHCMLDARRPWARRGGYWGGDGWFSRPHLVGGRLLCRVGGACVADEAGGAIAVRGGAGRAVTEVPLGDGREGRDGRDGARVWGGGGWETWAPYGVGVPCARAEDVSVECGRGRRLAATVCASDGERWVLSEGVLPVVLAALSFLLLVFSRACPQVTAWRPPHHAVPRRDGACCLPRRSVDADSLAAARPRRRYHTRCVPRERALGRPARQSHHCARVPGAAAAGGWFWTELYVQFIHVYVCDMASELPVPFFFLVVMCVCCQWYCAIASLLFPLKTARL